MKVIQMAGMGRRDFETLLVIRVTESAREPLLLDHPPSHFTARLSKRTSTDGYAHDTTRSI